MQLAGIWYLTEWMRLGKPKETQFVEFGPGRGTLMSDMLRVSTLDKSEIPLLKMLDRHSPNSLIFIRPSAMFI